MTQDPYPHLSSQRAAFKQTSVVLAVAILLVVALGGLSVKTILWAATPLLLLALADAACLWEQRRLAECSSAEKSGEEKSSPLRAETTGGSVMRILSALSARSIWPFYLGLFALIAAGAGNLPRRDTSPPASIAIAPSTETRLAQPSMPNSSFPRQMSPAERTAGSAVFPTPPPPLPGEQRPTTPIRWRSNTPINYAAKATPQAIVPSGPIPPSRPLVTPPARQNP